MPFKTDTQRKAFFAKQGSIRSDVVPKFFIVTGKIKGRQSKIIIETTASLKTIRKHSPIKPLKFQRISKVKATKLIKLGKKRGFIPTKTTRIGRGRIKSIPLTTKKN